MPNSAGWFSPGVRLKTGPFSSLPTPNASNSAIPTAVSIGQLSITRRKRSTLQVGIAVGSPTRPSGSLTSNRFTRP